MLRGTDRGWFYSTKEGTFWLLPQANRMWRLYYGQKRLGLYGNPNDAAADVAEGRCWHDDVRIASRELGVPNEVERWNFRMPDSPLISWPPSQPE
jgi:hypothetical protein